MGYIRAGLGCGKETIEREGASAKTNSLATFNIYTSDCKVNNFKQGRGW